MPRGTSQARSSAKKPADKKKEEVLEEDAAKSECVGCPLARAFGLCENACSMFGNIDINEFFLHMANARKEIMMGLKTLLDEAIRIEDERSERRQDASGKKSRGQDQLREISIE
ncbi:MAG: hypothetical protein A2V52_04690 [Actinobacteria bacterium RBG_19FT_COMBO_54_7]|uniref:Uncharacterized protein n=1 Tax=Candidatus Solincola sediminis TaxID=1797199 RepID=A0A1F2WIY0_9ACTN|nr:MAG: hypothetical protein A2Y75_06630 [Candidatus Solincola sediminis]OFW61062.1 MAG: hypothetical protein A2W01_07365 [Candidatus Solincola sediminis]OFW70195.1 MAG: hypothetical protein A2V52_04690 [Actinobacteria bacterium RBG_19FT_COMBO_54_7]